MVKMKPILVKDKETGTVFNDWVEKEYKDSDTDTWTQVCDECARKHHLLDSYLEIDAGQGICGVKGCSKEADHYYDFTRVPILPTKKTAGRKKGKTKTKPSSIRGVR
jgi:hypothetical protein